VILIRHAGEASWRAPATTAYADERALQELIARSPSLLPNTADAPIAVVRELAIPSIGYIDVVGVDIEGTITLVECKLRANPEIRRQVVGQVLAYAAGLWGMSYEAFDAAFTAIAGQSLADQVRLLSVDEWDETAFRATVTNNLDMGRFRLVIVVDELTDELGFNPARPENMQRTDVRFTCTPGNLACIDYGGGHGAKWSSHHAYQS
jgi:hypothetical protein